ncbi:ribosomal protein L7/L12 [Clostridium manihotivorum]|uniref:50S ribosomal protein L7/L12 n=1 Tax=Clostridium manihotivorum TaxID=2320868 RepID=A0A410DTJ6_9CLOT|nr:ribosomal protein L7/L12 [Clostridium manihotivorum]QAA32444.1 50S ribosomal protein L7/L12 [Clostridium manihotivorum]
MDDITMIILVIGAIILIILAIAVGKLRSDVANMKYTLEMIERKFGTSSVDNMNIRTEAPKSESLNNDLNDEIRKLILEGKKIKAIKVYRVATGVGLKEAKEYIDSFNIY